jgi:hypothetical protein
MLVTWWGQGYPNVPWRIARLEGIVGGVMMRLAALAAVVLMVAGCSSEPDDGAAEKPAVESVDVSPSAEPAGAEGGGEFTPEYASATELLDALRAGGIECDTEAEPAPTVASADAWFCYTNETRDDGYWLDVFVTAEQQGEGMVYMTDLNPGATYVVGTGWSVGVPSGSDGSEVVDAIGGQVYE